MKHERPKDLPPENLAPLDALSVFDFVIITPFPVFCSSIHLVSP